MSAHPDVLRRLRKLLALAKRGEGGEQQNAERMLRRTMEKHGVTIEQLESPTVERYWFPTPTKLDGKLFNQVVYKVIGHGKYSLWSRGRQRKTGVDLTHAQRLEVDFLYSLYRRQLKKELHTLWLAFVQKHDIFGTAAVDPEDRAPTMTPEERARMLAMMNGLTSLPIHKQIGREVA